MPPGPSLRYALLAGTLLAVGAPVGSASGQDAVLLGHVRDDEGAPVVAATLQLVRDSALAAVTETDGLGFFRFPAVGPGAYTIRVDRLGYASLEAAVTLAPGVTRELDLTVERRAVEVEGIEVRAERSRARARFEEIAGITVREMSRDELKRVPGVAEADPLRAVEVLPGVVSTSDLSSAFHVRGGSADQNLILLDGAPVFSPFHLGGFFSVFNADMLDRAELYSGGFSAEHGGRVSSVLAIETEPGDGDLRLDAGVSLLATRVAVGGGLDEGTRSALGLSRGRWRASVRRSYFDVLLTPFFDFPYHLTDIQGVFEGFTSSGDRFDVSVYTGADVLDLTRIDADDFPLRITWDWGNDVVGARWERPRARGGSVSASASWSRFGTGLLFPDFDDTEFSSEIEQLSLGLASDLVYRGGLRLRAGADADRLGYDNLAATGGTVFGEGEGTGWLLAGWALTEWRPERRWLVEAGLRIDSWHPDPGEGVVVPSPRIAVKRFLGEGDWALKAAAGRYTQFLHSLRDEELPLGLDVWVLAGARAPHVESDQLQLGVEGWLGDAWQVALEGYFRDFDGVVTFNSGDDPNDDTDDVLRGDGTSWGVDLLVKRSGTEVDGWLAVSWLKATRTFPDILSPLEPRPEYTYPPIFDRRLDVDLVLRFPVGRGWEGGLRWNLGTGTPYTRPLGSYAYYQPRFAGEGGRLVWRGGDDLTDDFGGWAVHLGDRNGERYPVYHRLDVSLRKEFRKSWGALVPHLDILNVYNRKNVLFYFYEFERSTPTRSGISMFPFLPSLGLEVTFR